MKLIGVDHVGIGSDFDGVSGNLPVELRSGVDYPNLVEGLKKRGHSDADIRKILGGNLLRVWGEVETPATRRCRGFPCPEKAKAPPRRVFLLSGFSPRRLRRSAYSLEAVFFTATFLAAGALATVLVAFFATGAAAVPAALVVALRALP